MAQITLQQAFDLAMQHHQAGRLQEAEKLYQQILAQQPAHYNAMHLLGVIAQQTGRNEMAVDLIRRAIALWPNFPEAYCNLGNALREQGQLDEAITAYRQAIALMPGNAELHSNLGNALNDKGQFDDAIAAYRRAIALNPNLPETHVNLGDSLKSKGLLDEAIGEYRNAITLRPGDAQAHSNLGNALRDKGQLDQAIAASQQAIVLNPNLPEAHVNLGNALRDKGQLNEAIAAYRQAIALRPNYAQALSNLGNALRGKGQLDEALAAYRQAIALNPNLPETFVNLGNALKDKGQLDEAIDAYRHAMALRPDYAEAHSNILIALHYHPGYDTKAIVEELRHWNRQHAEPLRKFIQPHFNNPDPERRLRIGYISADFREHASAYFLVPLLDHHDPLQAEVFCYAQVSRPDAFTERLQKRAARWRSIVGLSDENAARLILEDGIDILVDLKLHTAENRLLVFARKPAPVQVAWLGYPGSTGLSAIDYRLSDPYLDAPGVNESYYTEKTIHLPDSFWCYDPLDCREIPINSLPALKADVVTFGCLNTFCKFNDRIFALWGQVMRQVQNSRLILLAQLGSHRQWALDCLAREGIDPARVEFVPRQPRRRYMELYHRIDLGLDSFPCNGHTTSLDSFWMGVPVVSLVGQTAVSRAGWCQLSNLGLSHLASEIPDRFVEIAVALARDVPRLKELRSTLRQRMEASPLMNAPKFARSIEAAYRQMWRKWCAKNSANTDPQS